MKKGLALLSVALLGSATASSAPSAVSYTKVKAAKAAAPKARAPVARPADVAFGKFAIDAPAIGLGRAIPFEVTFAATVTPNSVGLLGDVLRAAAAAPSATLGAALLAGTSRKFGAAGAAQAFASEPSGAAAGAAGGLDQLLSLSPEKLQKGTLNGQIISIGLDENGNPLPVAQDIAAVPEPASWAMMITGFGLVGGAMRRRPITAARPSA